MKIDEMPVKESMSGEQTEYVQKQQREYKYIGRTKRIPGHTLFSYNRRTGEIKPAEMEKVYNMGYSGKSWTESRIKIEPYCFYGQALNRKNFEKRLRKLGMLNDNQE